MRCDEAKRDHLLRITRSISRGEKAAHGMSNQVHAAQTQRAEKLMQALHLLRISVRSGINPGALAPSGQIRGDHAIALGQPRCKAVQLSADAPNPCSKSTGSPFPPS